MALSSRKQGRRQAKTSRLHRKKRKSDVSRIGLKTLELDRREVDIAKREGALVKGEKELAKRETIVAAMIEKVEGRSASAGEMLGQLKAMLVACASLLEVTKSALADVAVLETEICTAHDQLDMEVQEKIRKRLRQHLDEAQAEGELQELKPKNDSLLNSTAVQFMLMLYLSLVRRGHSPNSAVQGTHDTLGTSRKRVMQVRNHWLDTKQLLTTNGKGRGMPKRGDDSRRALSKEQCAQLSLFIKTKHDEGRQIFQRTVGEWMEQHCDRSMSNRSVGRLLRWLGYVRRRRRIKIPPLTELRKARIRRFLIEMNDALDQEDEDRAIIVYMGESFVHQLHASAYSYFQRDNKGAVHDGFGRTSGKGQKMIMVHAMTKYGPLVTCDEDRFSIPEGPFKPNENGRGREGAGNLCEVPTAEFLRQAKHAKGDYHASMTGKVFMDCVKMRLTPAFKKMFGEDKSMILVLDNASYHHGYNEEVKVPESNSKTYNTSLLQKPWCEAHQGGADGQQLQESACNHNA